MVAGGSLHWYWSLCLIFSLFSGAANSLVSYVKFVFLLFLFLLLLLSVCVVALKITNTRNEHEIIITAEKTKGHSHTHTHARASACTKTQNYSTKIIKEPQWSKPFAFGGITSCRMYWRAGKFHCVRVWWQREKSESGSGATRWNKYRKDVHRF